ncbi:molybdopterin cofactor-binding domain-containing protein [Nonomuraea sp. NPDC003707]
MSGGGEASGRRLVMGAWVWFHDERHQVVGQSGSEVHLQSAGGVWTAIYIAALMAAPGFRLVGESPAESVAFAVDEVSIGRGRIHRTGSPERGEAYTDILVAHGLTELSAHGASTPADSRELGLAPAGPFGAKFVEVRVDPDLGLLRVARVVSVIDAGRILNEKTATSQIIGGTVGGIGMAMFEETVTDPGSGRIANATFGDYLIPVNADIPDMQVSFVGRPDRFNPVGVKGVGEIGLVGMGAAIANAVHHATGRRIRSLPITIDKLF